MAVQTIEQIKSAFRAGSNPTQADYINLIDTLASMGGSSIDQPVILVADYNLNSYLIGTSGSGIDMTWNKTAYDPIWAEELIKYTLDRDGRGSIYDDLTYVIIHNNNFWQYSDETRMFISTWDGPDYNKVITVIPNGSMVAFARSTTASSSYGGEESYSYEGLSANWRPVGNPIGITEYELSQLDQESNGGGGSGS